jgi:hypothetical protein
MAKEIGPWIGFDRKHSERLMADLPEVFSGLVLPKHSPGSSNPQKVEEWLSVNRDRITWEFLWALMARAFKAGKAHTGRKAATSKNQSPRDWVVSEWQNRADLGQSKASFARQYAPLVLARFKVKVTPRTIETRWLPKSAECGDSQ